MEQSNNKFLKAHLFVLRLLEPEIQFYMPSHAKTKDDRLQLVIA
ncbi:hypothetical protein CBM2634_U300003 [Cupriavidus taiwanensis]|uniref:Uncharacterized protein n=1 Tax=Cupriavidus taiwanensis TaxID=164546 RepID=A0A375JCF6_9BURK|nr:hypothetical protein CBM2634_U300003 [Cupriavidus taiwanensis]